MVVLIILSVVAILVIIAIVALRWVYGSPIEDLLPEKTIQTGEKVHIFMNGKYNRSATVTKVTQDYLYIYGNFSLPIAFRGKFYATAHLDDGTSLIYVGNRNHYKNVRTAEILRKIFNFLDSPFQLVPDEPIKFSGEGNEREEYVEPNEGEQQK